MNEELQELLTQIKRVIRENEELRERLRTLENQSSENGLSLYVASSKRKTFHRPSCKWAVYFLNSPNLLEFSSHDEAVEADYKPCKTCCA